VYENTPPEDIQPMKDFVKEIVETGFKAGLLREGMLQYPGMGKMADIDTTAESVWSFVSCPYDNCTRGKQRETSS
jgi:hypothetical protein